MCFVTVQFYVSCLIRHLTVQCDVCCVTSFVTALCHVSCLIRHVTVQCDVCCVTSFVTVLCDVSCYHVSLYKLFYGCPLGLSASKLNRKPQFSAPVSSLMMG